MFDSHIDLRKLRHDIQQLIVDCIHLKGVLRTTWTRPMAEEQRRLIRVRRKLTELFVLLAVVKKKLHVTRPPRTTAKEDWDPIAYNQTIAMRLFSDYALANVEVEEVHV